MHLRPHLRHLALPILVASAAALAGPAPIQSFHVMRVGSGPPMLLIPGLASSGEVWNAAVEHYRDRFDCHVLTLAGFAGQEAIPAPLLDTVRTDVIRYLRENHLERPVLVGHSLGGFVALWVAATAPDAVGPVVSVDGLPYLPALMDPAATPEGSRGRADGMRRFYAGLSRGQFSAQSRTALASMITDPKNVAMASAWSAASDPASVGHAMYELLTTDLRESIGSVKSPVLLVGAAGLSPDGEARAALEKAYESQVAKAPRHRVVMAEAARHFVMLDDPAFLFRTIDAFLAGDGR